MVRISCLNEAFLGLFELEASQLEGQQLKQKDKIRRKRKGEKRNILLIEGTSLSTNYLKMFICVYALTKMSQNVMIVETKTCLVIANYAFWSRLELTEHSWIHAENFKNVNKCVFSSNLHVWA